MPSVAVVNQMILEDYLEVWTQAFLTSKKSENLTPQSIAFYKLNLGIFIDYCKSVSIKTVSQLTPVALREFFIYLGESHNAGGVHCAFRSVRAFLNWYWFEVEPEGKNPISKVKAPKVPPVVIQGISREEFEKLLDVCDRGSFTGERDRTILLLLMDTGIRAMELCRIKLDNVNLLENSILIEQGKGRKPRTVFIGSTTRKQIRRYLKYRKESNYLFTNRSGDSLGYVALREIIRRVNVAANVKGISPHDFRRGFCLASLQAGVDLLTLSRLMGHTGLGLLSRYAQQSSSDLQAKFKSIVD